MNQVVQCSHRNPTTDTYSKTERPIYRNSGPVCRRRSALSTLRAAVIGTRVEVWEVEIMAVIRKVKLEVKGSPPVGRSGKLGSCLEAQV